MLHLWERDNPDAWWRHVRFVNVTLEAHKRDEMLIWVLRFEVANRPVVFLGDALDLDGDRVPGIADNNDVNALVVAEGEIRGETQPVKAG